MLKPVNLTPEQAQILQKNLQPKPQAPMQSMQDMMFEYKMKELSARSIAANARLCKLK